MSTRHLLLLRHAKSSWDDPDLEDFDRPLAARGIETAQAMGRAMAQRGWIPDKALVSKALRTRDTWRLLAPELQPARPQAVFSQALYEAAPETILAEIHGTPEDVSCLLVVGHNPGLEELARRLAGDGSEPKAVKALGEKFPTGALARFEIQDGWPALGFGHAALTDFLRPKDLA